MKISIINLGCPKNLVDGEKLIDSATKGGSSFSKDPKKADLIIVNTCSFIEEAKRESIREILKALSYKKEVIVTGCMVNRYEKELREEFPEVKAFINSFEIEKINEYLNIEKPKEIERFLMTPKSYAYLKIAEGCNKKCSFCAIPLIKGSFKSFKRDDILKEAKLLEEKGVKEVILVSQDSLYFGKDTKESLLDLLKELEKMSFEFIRILYLYPSYLEKDLISFIDDSPKVVSYFDIPTQHVSDKVLKSMRRGYTKKDLLSTIELILKLSKNKRPVLRTTFIIGYPEETEKEFEELIDFVKEGYFDYVGGFIYSHEENTHAYSLGDKISKEEKQRRFNIFESTCIENNEKKAKTFLEKSYKAIVDKVSNKEIYARAYFQAPDIDGLIILKKEPGIKEGDVINVKLYENIGVDLLGELS